MELKLLKLVENLESIANIELIDQNNSIVVRLSNTISAKLHVIACSVREPTQMVLPLNVSWLCFDPQSPYFKRLLVRQSKTADAAHGFTYTWKAAESYNEVFVDQYYDDADTAYLNDASVIRDATRTRSGIVRVTIDPAPNQPSIVVSEGDPRLSDARAPLPHTHPLQPAQSIQTTLAGGAAGAPVVIGTALPPVAGQVLYATSPTTAEWRNLHESDVT